MPKYLARLSNCWASITICNFILGPMPLPNTFKFILLLFTIIIGIKSFQHFDKLSVILGTSILGTGEIIIAISVFAGSLPAMFPQTDTKDGGLVPITALFIFYQIALTVVTIGGSLYQYRHFNEFHKDNVF